MDTDNPHVKTALRTIVMEPTLMRNTQILCAETEHISFGIYILKYGYSIQIRSKCNAQFASLVWP